MGVFGVCSLQCTLANTLLVLESPQNNKNSPSFHKFIATRFSRQRPLDGVHMKYPTPCSNSEVLTHLYLAGELVL